MLTGHRLLSSEHSADGLMPPYGTATQRIRCKRNASDVNFSLQPRNFKLITPILGVWTTLHTFLHFRLTYSFTVTSSSSVSPLYSSITPSLFHSRHTCFTNPTPAKDTSVKKPRIKSRRLSRHDNLLRKKEAIDNADQFQKQTVFPALHVGKCASESQLSTLSQMNTDCMPLIPITCHGDVIVVHRRTTKKKTQSQCTCTECRNVVFSNYDGHLEQGPCIVWDII